jgi:hypothetical protein
MHAPFRHFLLMVRVIAQRSHKGEVGRDLWFGCAVVNLNAAA